MGLLDWLKRMLGVSPAQQNLSPAPESVTPVPALEIPASTKPSERFPPSTLGLDASDFLPIDRDELAQGAKRNSLWNSPWFGRRDVIPPPSDPRTKLIDQALVTHGLLTPEQLIEIHEVGVEMERLRPSQTNLHQQAAAAGEAAVQAERDRRAAIKQQKKNEAAERKRLRAEAIAQRRATDINFLGRGVSGRLGERQSDITKLSVAGLPVLSSPPELAQALGLTIPRLRWLAFHTEVATGIHYIQFQVPKKSGGMRTLSVPHLSGAQEKRRHADLECSPSNARGGAELDFR